jgi:hypothetical protein
MSSLSRTLSFSTLSALCIGLLATLAGCPNDEEPVARCSPSCSSVQTCCSGICRSTFSDPANCGGCGITCESGELCVAQVCMPVARPTDTGVRVDASMPGRDAGMMTGACSPSCNASQQCCGTTCVNRMGTTPADSSFSNCRGCGIACDPMVADRCGASGCMCGTSLACTGDRRCGLNAMGSRGCIDFTTDEANCGGPGIACLAGETCTDSMCACGATGGRCMAPTVCLGAGATATCVDLTTDEMNCGMAGNVCGAGETCVASACHCGADTAPACARAGGFPPGCGQVCCAGACIPVDDMNCAACGTACTGTMECSIPIFGGAIGCAEPGGFITSCAD